jgi:hypothetical protein
MGLFIGGSAITLCELLDLVIVNAIRKYISHRKTTTRTLTFEVYGMSVDGVCKDKNKQQTATTSMT